MNAGQHFPRDGRGWSRGWQVWIGWVLASTLGWAVGGPAGVAAGPSGDIIAAGYAGAGLCGPLVGLAQWRVLRRRVARAGWWVAASTGAWIAGGPGVGTAAAILNAAVNANVAWAGLGMMYGVTTGWVLVWLLRQPRPGGDNRAAIRPER